MKCIHCSGTNLHKYGVRNGKQIYRCLDCYKFFTRTSKKHNGNTIINGKKYCTKCEEFKELSEFNLKNGKLRSNCKECDKKHTSRFSRYDLNKIEFQEMILNQNKKCAICKNEFKGNRYTYIDHNHQTGEVRGLLCPKCNNLLGNCNDNINVLKAAISYLKRETPYRSG